MSFGRRARKYSVDNKIIGGFSQNAFALSSYIIFKNSRGGGGGGGGGGARDWEVRLLFEGAAASDRRNMHG